jgi:lipid-A-disaccharide synthase
MPNTNNHTIFISAGEASGDLLGADLACALHQKNPDIKLVGMGSDRMRNAGVTIAFDSKLLSVVGLFEVVRHLPRILYTLHRIKKYLRKIKPSLVILIDFPDTHFHIMKYAKKIGIPILYYVSPQIWAWRSGRIHQLKKYVNHMAVLFSFEAKIYRDAKIPVTFVGHPLANIVKPTLSKTDAYNFFNLDVKHPIITLLPGSRNSEIRYHLDVMCDSVKKTQQHQNRSRSFL